MQVYGIYYGKNKRESYNNCLGYFPGKEMIPDMVALLKAKDYHFEVVKINVEHGVTEENNYFFFRAFGRG